MQTADLSRIVDHCVRMNAVCQVALWKDKCHWWIRNVPQGTGRVREVMMGPLLVKRWGDWY